MVGDLTLYYFFFMLKGFALHYFLIMNKELRRAIARPADHR